MWRIIYWLAFVLTWAILPILQSFVESGHHDSLLKLKEALRQNAKYQAILLGTGLIGLFYIIVTSGLSLSSIRALVIALSHCYALVIAIWLMGHGMVNLPRSLWHNASIDRKLRDHYCIAVHVSDQFAEAQQSFAEVVTEVLQLSAIKNGNHNVEWIDELLDEIRSGPSAPLDHVMHSSRHHNTSVPDAGSITEEYLSNLSKRLYKTKTRLVRHRAAWQKLLKDCSIAEDIQSARNSESQKSLVFRFGKTKLPPRMAYYYYTSIHSHIVRIFAAVLAGLSIILVWSELVHGTVASLVNLCITHTHGIEQQLVSSLFLGYMCLTAFLSLAQIKIFNVYALVYKGSDISSLLFYATYACRLTVPLSFNYLNLISSRDSVFEEFLGKSINLLTLGKFVNDWLPRMILIPVLLTVFHFYDKIRGYFSFDFAFDDEDETLMGSNIEGREIVKRSLTDPRYRFAYDRIVDHAGEGTQANGSSFSNSPSLFGAPSLTPSNIGRFSNTLAPSTSPQGYHRPTLHFEPMNETPVDRVKSFFGGLGERLQQTVSDARDRIRGDGFENQPLTHV